MFSTLLALVRTHATRLYALGMAHKITSIIVVCALLGVGYWGYGKLASTTGEALYVLATVERGTIVVSITGTGQVSASNQLDVKAKVSGEIISVPVKNGQFVRAGTTIAVIDPSQAQKAVRDAQANLESAQISLEKLQAPANELSMTQAENNAESAKTNLASAYDTAFNQISSTFLDAPTVMTGLNSLLTSYERTLGGSSQQNIDFYANAIAQYDTTGKATLYRDDALAKYNAAKASFDTAFAKYKATSRTADSATIETVLNDTYVMTQAMFDATKSINNLVQLYQDVYTTRNLTPASLSTTHLSTLGGYTSTINSHLSSVSSSVNSIASDKQNVVETAQTLANLKEGADALDLRSAELSVTQRQNALRDAQEALADYYVRAPFDGTIATLNAKLHDSAGSSALATLITQAKVAELSLNEVDAAKVKVGDKATLTFDAIPDLIIAGTVSDIDTVGTVSQGVVTYAVKVAFDTDDARIKTGMSVSAAIQIDVHQDVLTVPVSAVKTGGSRSYVEVFDPAIADTGGTQGTPSKTAPQQVEVEAGLSDDISIEILSGLEEGAQIITRTITASTQTASQTPSILNAVGGSRATGGPGR